MPADRSDRIGHRDVAQREAALALGVRVAVHDSRQNDPDPHVWQPGQDYRPPTPSKPPADEPARARWVRSGSAPNANHQQHKGASVMATDNHTTIVGNLVDDPELRFTL